MIKKFFTTPLKVYQYISRMTPASCRYYPTCSEYARWHLDNSPLHIALPSSAYRIMRCNQLFIGGIDYPVSAFRPVATTMLQNEFIVAQKAYISTGKCKIKPSCGKMSIVYWRVPVGFKYAIIKDFNDYNSKKST